MACGLGDLPSVWVQSRETANSRAASCTKLHSKQQQCQAAACLPVLCLQLQAQCLAPRPAPKLGQLPIGG